MIIIAYVVVILGVIVVAYKSVKELIQKFLNLY